MAQARPPEQLASGAFWLTMAALAAWIAAGFYIILN
jgi:hypothetical protein